MKKILLVTTALVMLTATAQAKMFELHLKQGSIDETRGFDSVLDVFDHYEDGSLNSIFNNYDKTAAADGWLNFRGVMMNFNFDNSGNLTFTVPSIGINQPFNGGGQEASFKMFKDWLKNNKDGLLQKILKATVADTPYDMVAGNPNSLMANMADNTFQRGGGGVLGNFLSYVSPNASTHYFKFNGDEKKASVYSLPIGKTFKFDNGSKLMFDMPVYYTDMDGSASYSAQLGLAYMFPLIKKDGFKWNLTPGVRGGAVYSEDMLSGGLLYSGSITSHMSMPVGAFTYGLTNMVGYIRDFSIEAAGYEVDYDLKNMVYKNGVSVDYALNDKWSLGTSYSYTFYSGSELFIEDYHDLTLSLTRKFREGSLFSGRALVGNYSFDGDDYYAYRVGINFLF
ncbi:MAG: hypothetical protein IKK52_04515 [Alphaproteobacteria bacterium]|nr:hypothetical protein [Alphaproteobacteria bacterium]